MGFLTAERGTLYTTGFFFSSENTLSPVIYLFLFLFFYKVVASTFLQTTSLVLSFPEYTELGIQLTKRLN